MDEIKVSIICNAYNHEKYIADALESFVMQKTNFKYEVLIHDDASTDKTAEIIRKYEEKYPDIIKPIYQTENQYSQKVKIGHTYQFPRAQGEYIAICEGDDYWSDEHKLQRQYDYMEQHPEIDMCAHKAVAIDATTQKVKFHFPEIAEDTLFSTEDVIDTCFPTNSLFYRKNITENEPMFRQQLALDYTLQLHGALRGGIYCFSDDMSVYRCMTENSWTRKMVSNPQRFIENKKKIIEMLHTFDKETEYKYREQVKSRIKRYEMEIWQLKGEYKKVFTKEYKAELKKMPRKEKIMLYIKAYLPIVHKLYREIRNR